MIEIKSPDKNRRYRVFALEAWHDPPRETGTIRLKPQGKLMSPRWLYWDNPINGIGQKEVASLIRFWNNKAPWETRELVDDW